MFSVDICRVTETCIQDPTSWTPFAVQMQPTLPSLFTRHMIRLRALVVRVALSMRAKRAPLECTPLKLLLYAVRLDGSVCVNNSQLRRHCSLVVSVYEPTDCGSLETKDECYRALSRLFRSVRSMDAVVVVDDFSAQLEYLAQTEQRIEGRFSAPGD